MSQHSSEIELKKKIEAVKQSVIVGSCYHHYKDTSKEYQVINIVIDESTEEPLVIYKALYGEGLTWSRPYSSWCSIIESGTEQGTTRFTKITL